jgi:hypothetical protein
MNASQIESAIEHAINALSLAKLALSKSALPMFNESDTIRKADAPRDTYDHARRALGISYDPSAAALAALTDAERRITALESAAVANANAEARAASVREIGR